MVTEKILSVVSYWNDEFNIFHSITTALHTCTQHENGKHWPTLKVFQGFFSIADWSKTVKTQVETIRSTKILQET